MSKDEFGGIALQDEFGGVPVEDEFGGIAVEEAALPEAAPSAKPDSLSMPSARAGFIAPEDLRRAVPLGKPVTTLELEQQRLQETRERDIARAREREAASLTPAQIQRLDTGTVAENLMTAPPGVEWTPPTAAELQQRFPSLNEDSTKILAGLAQTLSGAWNFMASPVGGAGAVVAPLAGAGGIAGAVGKAALGTFAIEAVRHTPQTVADFNEAVRSGDPEAIARTGSQLLLNTAVGAGAGRGVRESVRAIPAQEAGALAAKARHAGLDQAAAALDDLARQVERTEILGAEARAVGAFEPTPSELLRTPEAVRRTQELQVTEAPAAPAPEMLSPETLGPLIDPGYRREIVLQATEAAEMIKAARQRRAELESSKLPQGEPAVTGPTPGFAKTAEQRLLQRSDLTREVVRDIRDITQSTPLKDVEQLVRDRLERRDFAEAVAALGQLKAETSRKLVDKLLGVSKESVPLSAGERTIFNEIWEATLEKLGAKPLVPIEPSLIQRLESLRTPLDPTKLPSNPFPEIARAVWNTSIDIAIAAVKAGASIKAALDAALSHLRKNAQGFDEAAVRSYMERLVTAETRTDQGRKAAATVSEQPKLEKAPVRATEPTAPAEPLPSPALRPLGEFYSEPIVERLGRLGGPVSRKVTQENLGIIDSAKRLYGELAATTLDAAKRAVGRAFRGGSTWLHGLREITPNAAVGRFHDVIETRARTGTLDHVPAEHRALVEQLFTTNFAIGELARRANPDFNPSGRAQRMLTGYGYDIIRRGRGRAWDAWAEGLSRANNMPIERTRAFLRRWKSELDKPGADTTHLDRIAQDFERFFPNVVTHVRPTRGLGWHEIVHSSPFSYLEAAAQRTSHAAAFREVYPLVRHEGKLVPSGKLEATRAAVQKELNTSRHAAEFDNAMRALQGHPLDSFTSWWNAPDTLIGAGLRAYDVAMRPLRSLMLSASLPVNIGEALSGGAHIFLGYGRAFKAMTRAEQFEQLKRNGMLNAAIRDFSFDPSQPLRSTSRQTANVISRTFLSDFMNELQEFTGASAAKIVADQIRSGTLPASEQLRISNVMRAMGIDKRSALEAARGNNPKAVQEFETKAAEFLSAGNKATAEQSRWGASRAFQSLFWFHSYPMSKMRQFRSLLNNLIEDAGVRDFKSAQDNAVLLGRYLGGTALGGALTTGIMRLIYEGLFGSKIQLQEAQDDFGGFLLEAVKMGMGGPVQITARILEQGADTGAIGSVLVGSMAPVGVAEELSNAVTGTGKYEGADTFERVGLFLKSKTPAARALKQGMAAWGLAQDNAELDAAIKAFYRWRRDKYGFTQHKFFLEDEHDRKQFRGHMKKAVEALKDEKWEEYEAEVELALQDPALAEKSSKELRKTVSASLRGRQLLQTPTGAALTPEELDELRQRIGSEAVEKLELFDELLKAEARR